MDYALVAVLGVVVVVVTAAFSRRLGVAAPLLLVLVGIGYSYIPGVPQIEVEPDIILMGVLPPLLYAAAINVPVVDFRRNFASISALSVVLVVVSALTTGFVLFLLLDRLVWCRDRARCRHQPHGMWWPPPRSPSAWACHRVWLHPGGRGSSTMCTARHSAQPLQPPRSPRRGRSTVGTVLADFGYAVAVALAIGVLVGVGGLLRRKSTNCAGHRDLVRGALHRLHPRRRTARLGVIAVVAAGLYSGHSSAHFSPQSRISSASTGAL
ncbi:MAG: cation:proton antiporter [Schumannella sp.]